METGGSAWYQKKSPETSQHSGTRIIKIIHAKDTYQFSRIGFGYGYSEDPALTTPHKVQAYLADLWFYGLSNQATGRAPRLQQALGVSKLPEVAEKGDHEVLKASWYIGTSWYWMSCCCFFFMFFHVFSSTCPWAINLTDWWRFGSATRFFLKVGGVLTRSKYALQYFINSLIFKHLHVRCSVIHLQSLITDFNEFHPSVPDLLSTILTESLYSCPWVHHRSSHSGFWKTRASDPLALAEVDSLARLRSCWLVLDKSHCVWWIHGVNPWRDARKNLGTGEEVIDQLKLTLLKRSCLQNTLRIMGTAKKGHCLFSDRTCLRDKFG